MKIRFAFKVLTATAALALTLPSLAILERTASAQQMSDTERKSAARAAYSEGVKLQDEGKHEDALKRFEAAQKFFDAPTHLLHIAECQAMTGRLVEASETYELLSRKSLPPGSPDAFIQAQQQGQAELPALRARVPTLRVTTKPEAGQLQGLQVNVNGVNMPVELIGIARPLNPGVYRFTAQAQGYGTEKYVDVPLGEKENKSIELVLVARTGGPVVVTPPPPPPPYQNQYQERPADRSSDGPTQFGMLFGVRGGATVPAGNMSLTLPVSDFATAGGGFGIDLYFRLVKMLLIGGTFEWSSLGTPSSLRGGVNGQQYETSASTNYAAFQIGIVPNVDKTSFIGDIGIGSRTMRRSALNLSTGREGKDSFSGLEFGLGLGVSIPAGPIRIVPKVNMSLGSFGSYEGTPEGGTTTPSQDIASASKSTHFVLGVGLALYYSLPFGPKPGAAPAPASGGPSSQ